MEHTSLFIRHLKPLDNKYTRWYLAIIERSISRGTTSRHKGRKMFGYIERHHIIPKSLGGPNLKHNFAYLTAREHFMAHRLLPKMFSKDTESWKAMVYAYYRVSNRFMKNGTTKVNSREFERLRIQYSVLCSQRMTEKGGWDVIVWNPERRKAHSEKLKAEYISGKRVPWNKGRKGYASSRKGTPTPKATCPHCTKQYGAYKISSHIPKCVLHPENMRKCRSCAEIIKSKQNGIYCSNRCSSIEKNSKRYKVTGPDGTVYDVFNLSKFCRERGLAQSNMSKNRVHGWNVEKLD